ncbi:hypothetical protein RhiirA1_486364 [Rhizophagus irregularis]|uniref:Uncharacterized protein n=1 Tax=Rhizophagus irregularis TaxID=588596 RepID=A0A2I1FQH3_9GLOM|nr:hypothetical protein RhiirA1_486364 [Rhizophagus irregularis]PKY36604.1 hypothetical protein RhiirB3_459610 [Rhizophagus irregularis]
MQYMFKLYLKKHVPGDVKLCFIRDFYNDNHKINMHELQTWRVMLEAIGCKNITPFKKM